MRKIDWNKSSQDWTYYNTSKYRFVSGTGGGWYKIRDAYNLSTLFWAKYS